ncbi:T9SS type A sorting domain-containing protein [Echinicola jeungdonensis]|uniref:T9SS type A sorting domain-containing protein n=1 Tax=Echinicola jeungdonensis TaxID=709343 RepID=A0ABV5J7J9_9BACT|nr:T9SS type A sorting domain-containing protein [Echinicola jeungdonensis]MDN3669725.1 T9SS type A sorting domain-containing protein [Echinicola jeungdonensis]
MKNFLSLCAIIFMLLQYTETEARQVRVLSENITFNGKINSTQRKSVILQNESSKAKEYVLKFMRGNIGSSQDIKVCIGDQCYDPRKDLAKIKLNLEPGEIFTDLYIEFDLGITETKGTFDLHFSNPDNLRDVFLIESVYEVFSPSGSESEVDHESISLGSVYPNPSYRTAQIDYKIKDPNANIKLVINSFIGNFIDEYTLSPEQNTLLINVNDYNPGVYFYTLIVDSKNIVTKKLVVKK